MRTAFVPKTLGLTYKIYIADILGLLKDKAKAMYVIAVLGLLRFL